MNSHQTRTHSSLFALAGIGAALLVGGIARGAVDPGRLPAAAARAVSFETEVQPMLAQHCYSCHGAEKQKADFRLDLKEKALQGGESGAAVIPGKSAESLLIHLVSGVDPDRVMPQKGERLTAAQIGLLRAWIDQGAEWPEHLAGSSGPTNYWAFEPIKRPRAPVVRNSTPRVASPIDRFILAKLQENGLAFASPADKATLLRRATFDLTGLPPTVAELSAFLRDNSPDAFAKVVDRLLGSPHYGERWARHWLDLARFCESDGFEYDKMREHAWHYRDYLVRSFNEDKPYAQFVREQIAGDALEPATRGGIMATAFLTAGPYDQAGNSSASALLKARVREEEMEDIIAGVSQTFLAMTVNCARCHDHKFDPIPQGDYYRMKAALDGVRHGNRPLATSSEVQAREQQKARINEGIVRAEKRIGSLDAAARQRAAGDQSNRVANPGSGPAPVSRWTFEGDARDEVGGLHGELEGGAKVERGRLVLDGRKAFVRTPPIGRDIREKTLEAFVRLPDLAQRGGGVISIETVDGGTFDAIVFGEREPRKWMAGSSFYQRTRDLNGAGEDARSDELVHVTIVYSADNRIAIYRNGVPFGDSYMPEGENGGLQTYSAGGARLLFGLRHTGAGNGYLAGEIEEVRLYDRALTASEVLRSAQSMPVITPDALARAMTDAERKERAALSGQVAQGREALKKVPALEDVYAAVSRQPEPTFILARGDVEKKRKQVKAGGLTALTGGAEFELAADAPEGQRRVQLANWIVSTNNPLAWRVMANRVWHHHFGRGLVPTPNDFGTMSEPPSHPELLDWLASELIAQGGSLKKLHRTILLSDTYQQSSAAADVRRFTPGSARGQSLFTPAATPGKKVDAENRLLSRFPLRRLEAEAVRDAMLSVSGQLNPKMGGPSFRPFKVTISGSHFYELTDPIGDEFNRRTIYRMNIQSGKEPLLDALDCPDPSTKTPVRSVTTTPIQSLGLMNNGFVQRQCRHLAERLQKEAGDNAAEQIRLGYRLAFSREPRPDELRDHVVLAQTHGLESVCWVLFNSSEFLYVK